MKEVFSRSMDTMNHNYVIILLWTGMQKHIWYSYLTIWIPCIIIRLFFCDALKWEDVFTTICQGNRNIYFALWNYAPCALCK